MAEEESVKNMDTEEIEENKKSAVKKKKPGIIYLSTLPPFMNVTKIKDIFSCYGEIGRVFLQPASEGTKKKPAIHFSEGWIEFMSKRVAKSVAAKMNNTQVGGKKRSKFYDFIWNIKYLPRFKWTHLGERLAYERAIHKQRLRAEIALAKREANFFSANLDKKRKKPQMDEDHQNNIKMKPVKNDYETKTSSDRSDIFQSLFTK